MSLTFLCYIPNSLEPGHREEEPVDGWGTLEYSTELARSAEAHGWGGALIGTGWGRPDTFTVATALAAQTSTFKPLTAIRPGYWQPAHFASAAATLDRLTRGRLLINIVSGADNQASYGDELVDSARRYDRTREFIRLVRRLWAEDDVDFDGSYYRVKSASLNVRPAGFATGTHPTIYFGGASPAAERVAAAEADVQLFWGEPLDGVAERIERLRTLSGAVGRDHAPLRFGLRITTLVRDTTEQAWHDAEEKVAKMAAGTDGPRAGRARQGAVGQQRLLALAQRGEVLDTCLYTTPGTFGGGGAGTTWLVGSAADVAQALEKYHELGVTHFVLSDTPHRSEIVRLGDQLLPRLRPETAAVGAMVAADG
ncbi:MAG: LLM class flavin-dependent oxidoreductase [Solirubrobacteraceae bacterium]